MKHAYHVTTQAAVPSLLSQGLQPRIGPRSTDLGETLARVYLFPDLETVEDALVNWLGEQFDDDEPLAIVKINVHGMHLDDSVGYERTTQELIPPTAIVAVFGEDFEPLMARHPQIEPAREALTLYLKDCPEESSSLAALQAQLGNDPDPFARHNMTGHITTSALVLSEDGSQVLMIHHNDFDKLLQPGGHHEGVESLFDSARREAVEETGVIGLVKHAWTVKNDRVFDFDTHAIAANPKKGEGDHFHHDAIYLFQANANLPLQPQIEEVKQAAWFPVGDLLLSENSRLNRLHEKLQREGLLPAPTRTPKP